MELQDSLCTQRKAVNHSRGSGKIFQRKLGSKLLVGSISKEEKGGRMFQTKENGVRRENRTTGQIKTWSLVGEKRLKLGVAKYGMRSALSNG